MLVLRIIATVFIGLSILSCLLKNVNIFGDSRKGFGRNLSDDWMVIIATLIGWLWRAFVIVALWLI